MADTLKSKEVKIRKSRRCWGCAILKPIGSAMQYVVVVDSGLLTASYWCEICDCYLTENFGEFQDGVVYGEFKGESHYESFRKEYLSPERKIILEKNNFLSNPCKKIVYG